MRKLIPILALAFTACLFYTCQKETSMGADRARLQVYLTDDPGAFDEVIIDIQDVKVHLSSDTSGGWQSLSQVRTGTYDLLQLVDDKDTLLGGADLPSGRIEQIRLVLGPNNYVKVDGQTYELKTPSAQQSGLKLNVHQDIQAGVTYKLLLDFDVLGETIEVRQGATVYLTGVLSLTLTELAEPTIVETELPLLNLNKK